MTYLFPIPDTPPVGGVLLYKLCVPADIRYSGLVVAALSYLLDEENYANEPVNADFPPPDPSAVIQEMFKVYESFTPMRGRVGEVVWSMINPTNAPDGWLLADGRVIDADDYPELADVLGSEWLATPSPPGVTNYKMPNLMGAYPSGRDAGDMQTRPGANSVQLTVDQMPNHRHRTSFATQLTPVGELGAVNRYAPTLSGVNTQSEGGDQAHENRPLTQYLYPYVIAFDGC